MAMEEETNQSAREQKLVRNCILEILKRHGYNHDSPLAHRDFEHLSNEIESRTGILISVSTLKRLLHGEFSRIPQIATLNAISSYLGFKNWYDYKQSQTKQEHSKDERPDDAQAFVPKKINHPLSSPVKWVTISALAFVCITIVFLFVQYSPGREINNIENASFSAEKTTNNDLPNTVVFHYNVDEVEADSFFIQQSWDDNKRVKVSKNNYTLTDIYYEPGYHTAKLIANDSIIKTVPVSIPTDRWFLFAKDLAPKSIPQYVKSSSFIHNGLLTLDDSDLQVNQIDITREKTFVYSFFPSAFNVSTDNYILKTRVKVREVRNNLCANLMVEVTGQQSFTFFTTNSKGCSSESMALFGDKFFDGKTHDLSPLGYDVTKWMTIEIKVLNKHVTISLDARPVFSTAYKISPGLITGVVFASNGLPEVDFVDLKGLDGTIVYQNEFDEPNGSKQQLSN